MTHAETLPQAHHPFPRPEVPTSQYAELTDHEHIHKRTTIEHMGHQARSISHTWISNVDLVI